MYNFKTLSAFVIIGFALSSCVNSKDNMDASGSFEAEETIISAEAAGVIEQFNLEEGQNLVQGQIIGYIDSTQLYLKKKQLNEQVEALMTKKPQITVQLTALNEQLKTVQKEQTRYTNLVNADAAPRKQLDDLNAQAIVIKSQIEAQKSTLNISTEGINKDANPVYVQIEQIEDQLSKCIITNPVNGTVLTKYVQQNEMASPGKPLYKIADLSVIILRVYITGNQLPLVKLNQMVKVLTDDGNGGFKEAEGMITWISNKAEFTPKTIQTKEERANLVYAVKVTVKNDGGYKIGMYGEIKFL